MCHHAFVQQRVLPSLQLLFLTVLLIASPSTASDPPLISEVSPQTFDTTGGQTVRFGGLRLGEQGSSVSVTYGVSGEYKATGCHVVTNQTVVECTSPAGIGAGLDIYFITSSGAHAQVASGVAVSYMAPTIRKLEAPSILSSSGSSTGITFTGNHFGPPSTSAYEVRVINSAGGVYKSTSCSSTSPTSDTVVKCSVPSGVGKGLSFVLVVGGQSATAPATDSSPRYESPIITGLSAPSPLACAGGTPVTISGSGFGGRQVESKFVAVTYGPKTATEISASACVVKSDSTIECQGAPGFGANQQWLVIIADQASGKSGSSLMTSYHQPVITDLDVPGAFGTAGGDVVTVTGSNLGIASSDPLWGILGATASATYGPHGDAFPAACTVESSTQMSCTTSPGAGAHLTWVAIIAGLKSDVSSQTTSYDPPSVTDVLSGGVSPTKGGSLFSFSGENFGAQGKGFSLDVQYAANFDPNSPTYTATNCAVVTSHSLIQCETEPGVGANLRIRVTVEGVTGLPSQQSAASMLRYASPSVTSISVSTASGKLNTAGGEPVVLSCQNVGPSNAGSLGVTYGPPTLPTRFTARQCSVTVDHTQVTCQSAPGTGKLIPTSFQQSLFLSPSVFLYSFSITFSICVPVKHSTPFPLFFS